MQDKQLYRSKFRVKATLKTLKEVKDVFPEIVKTEDNLDQEVYLIENLDMSIQPEYEGLAEGYVSYHTKENFVKIYEPIE